MSQGKTCLIIRPNTFVTSLAKQIFSMLRNMLVTHTHIHIFTHTQSHTHTHTHKHPHTHTHTHTQTHSHTQSHTCSHTHANDSKQVYPSLFALYFMIWYCCRHSPQHLTSSLFLITASNCFHLSTQTSYGTATSIVVQASA